MGPSKKEGTMHCPKCQFENPDGFAFCGKCGTQLDRVCAKCNFANPADFVYCGKCGHPLIPSSPIDFTHPPSYTPKFLAEKILTTRSSLEGERKLVTVLFADVANYTSLSEKLDPEEVHQIREQETPTRRKGRPGAGLTELLLGVTTGRVFPLASHPGPEDDHTWGGVR
jgi:hypothetical protein